MKQRVKNKRLKESSRVWMQRHLNDPFVAKAQKEGYRSRAAFKILEIQDKFKVFNKESIVVDLGAAPGGWSQVISKKCKQVIAIDLLDMDPLPNVDFIIGDFLKEESLKMLDTIINSAKVDVVMSDMAPSTCGIRKIDHLRIMALAEAVFEFAEKNLKQGGSMIIKVFQGGAEQQLLNKIKHSFQKVQHFKPKSSRKESPETYLIAMDFIEKIG